MNVAIQLLGPLNGISFISGPKPRLHYKDSYTKVAEILWSLVPIPNLPVPTLMPVVAGQSPGVPTLNFAVPIPTRPVPALNFGVPALIRAVCTLTRPVPTLCFAVGIQRLI